MPFFSNAKDDNLPGEPAPRITTIPATEQHRCYNPAIHGDATVRIRTVDAPDNLN